jgi:hypothetical protein
MASQYDFTVTLHDLAFILKQIKNIQRQLTQTGALMLKCFGN